MFKIRWDTGAIRDLKSIDKKIAKQIITKVESYLSKNPRALGKPLTADYSGLYRYRFGDYRVIYEINEKEITITVVKVGHRKKFTDKRQLL